MSNKMTRRLDKRRTFQTPSGVVEVRAGRITFFTPSMTFRKEFELKPGSTFEPELSDFSDDGKYLAVLELRPRANKAHVFEMETGKKMTTVKLRSSVERPVVFDDASVVTGVHGPVVKKFGPDGKLSFLINDVRNMVVSKANKLLFVNFDDGPTSYVFDATTGDPISSVGGEKVNVADGPGVFVVAVPSKFNAHSLTTYDVVTVSPTNTFFLNVDSPKTPHVFSKPVFYHVLSEDGRNYAVEVPVKDSNGWVRDRVELYIFDLVSGEVVSAEYVKSRRSFTSPKFKGRKFTYYSDGKMAVKDLSLAPEHVRVTPGGRLL